jgi:type 1 glutamine amidotransferase
VNRKKDGLVKVLILSGKNNHEWQKTTPLLAKIYKDSRLFKINITEIPDTLTYNELIKYDVIVSNWNTWPDNDLRMTKEWEDDFLKYVKDGGGVVFIHAGASSFYSWDEYHRMGIGRWGKETNHGKQQKGKIEGFDQSHPITKGFMDFYITDELWEKTDIYPDARALASVSANNEKDGHLISEKAVFVNRIGEGRNFFTTLGHNERALLNSGLQTLLLRATQWASHRKVTIQPPTDFKKRATSEGNSLSWEQSDSTLSLSNNSGKIWQYNFNNRFGNPYFHPVTLKNSALTCASPPDHPWHLGLWFSWKFINGVNYWEYLDDFKSEETGYKSAGITEIQKTDIIKNPDFSADIRMELRYHPADSGAVMTEKRNIHISPPLSDGSYFIDHENIFDPLVDEVVLDRTPIEGEPEGKSWGGYAGLSIRFNQDFTSPEIIVPTDSDNFKKSNWLYMGFNTLTGEKAGLCILQNLKFTTSTTSWYVFNDPEIPFYYYSPAVLFDGRIVLKKGESLHLKYRIWILPGKIGKKEIQNKYDEYVNN